MDLRKIAEENLAICEVGEYLSPGGEWKSLPVGEAKKRTVLYTPENFGTLHSLGERGSGVVVEVTNETTSESLCRLVRGGERVAGLNFASGKNPGGGFLRGTSTQEEHLCQCSALYPCLVTQPAFYKANQAATPLYTDHIIYSPDVPFFRDTRLLFLEEPFQASIITAPAPNFAALQKSWTKLLPKVRSVLEDRSRAILEVAVAQLHRVLVLGAWGCGVFGNDPKMVAEAFKKHLKVEFKHLFDRVIFAIPGRGENCSVFKDVFF